jgi:hypothetical protein
MVWASGRVGPRPGRAGRPPSLAFQLFRPQLIGNEYHKLLCNEHYPHNSLFKLLIKKYMYMYIYIVSNVLIQIYILYFVHKALCTFVLYFFLRQLFKIRPLLIIDKRIRVRVNI